VVGSVVTILGFVVGLRWGALGVALAYSITVCALRTPALLYCYHTTPVTMGDLVRAIWRPAAASLAAGALIALVDRLAAPDLSLVPGLILEAALFVLLYLGAWYLLPRGRQATREVFDLLRVLRPPPRETGSEEGEASWRTGE
jgi:PST family polysaccharide transporter